jgi:chorismate dehydratase
LFLESTNYFAKFDYLGKNNAMKIRISLVHYLNAAPLGWAFQHGPYKECFDVVPASPANCADQLFQGQADIGLIPSIEYQRIPDLQIVPELSIASLHKVRSLLLIKPKGKEKIFTVALDTSSRTTIALAKILLWATMDIHPQFLPCPPDINQMLARSDAAILIGDAALQVNLEDYDTIDLVEAWVSWQSRPFVCAFWACRKAPMISSDLNALFMEAKEWGLKHVSEIAAAYARSLKLPAPFLENYLTHNIDYSLSPAHIEGLWEFYSQANRLGLIPGLKPLEFLQ